MKISLDNLSQKFKKTIHTKEWLSLFAMSAKAKRIFIIANGGLYSVANHLCDDANRLLFKAGRKKTFYAPDSVCFITSVSNDFGFNECFVKWLQIQQLGKDCLVIGMSCSGRSKNVLTGLHYARECGSYTALISGQSANLVHKHTTEVELKTKYFHSTEILCTILLYELIAELGGVCPLISDEIQRKSISFHRSRKDE